MRSKEFSSLGGTALKIYLVLYKEGKPLGLNDIQRKAELSTASLVHYHISKLMNQGLVSEREGGYVVEKAVFENILRIRRSFIPFQTTFAVFFSTTLVGLLFFVRPSTLSSLYLLAIAINVVAVGIFLYQTFDTLKKWKV